LALLRHSGFSTSGSLHIAIPYLTYSAYEKETACQSREVPSSGLQRKSSMNMKKPGLAALWLSLTCAVPAWAQAVDPNLGRNMAANCASCHGTNGASVGGMPTLAGQPRDYLARAMKEFREGKRPATIMHQLSKGYSDEQIELIAAYLSAQKAK
jgi:sulfide dehydrogenase cytochrome subunit